MDRKIRFNMQTEFFYPRTDQFPAILRFYIVFFSVGVFKDKKLAETSWIVFRLQTAITLFRKDIES
jgi:hypothetical protein